MKEFRNKHKGESMLVCGLGPSLLEVPRNPPIASIGVNDCWARVATDYLLVLGDPDAHFTAERRRIIWGSKPQAFFMEKGGKDAWLSYWNQDWDNDGMGHIVVPHFNFPHEEPLKRGRIYKVTETSPGTALGIALYMGATRIGLIGVDLYDHPNLGDKIEEMNARFEQMNKVAAVYGAKIYNLSPRSALTCYPYCSYQEFLDGSQHRPEDAGLLPEAGMGSAEGRALE